MISTWPASEKLAKVSGPTLEIRLRGSRLALLDVGGQPDSEIIFKISVCERGREGSEGIALRARNVRL